jgi:hypothetical protein
MVAGSRSSPSAVFCTAKPAEIRPSNTSCTDRSMWSGCSPSENVRPASGSRSTSSTRWSSSARATPRPATVVVLATPPFSLATATRRVIAAPSTGRPQPVTADRYATDLPRQQPSRFADYRGPRVQTATVIGRPPGAGTLHVAPGAASGRQTSRGASRHRVAVGVWSQLLRDPETDPLRDSRPASRQRSTARRFGCRPPLNAGRWSAGDAARQSSCTDVSSAIERVGDAGGTGDRPRRDPRRDHRAVPGRPARRRQPSTNQRPGRAMPGPDAATSPRGVCPPTSAGGSGVATEDSVADPSRERPAPAARPARR